MASPLACQDIIARHSLNILSDTSTSNRGDKKKALASFKKECTEQLETWGDQGVTNILSDLFDRMSIWAISDIEYVREQVALLYLQMIHHATLSSELLDRILELVHQRLKHQQLATTKTIIVEPTEEVRAVWLDIMLHIASEQRVISATQVEKALDILQLAIRDTSPDVQKRAGNALTELAKQHPNEIALTGERPMRMNLDLLHHKHSALRVIGLQCSEKLGLAFPSAIHLLFEHDEASKRQPVFPLLVYDNALMVRMALIQVASSLLINVTPKHRYTNTPMLVPILLSCAADDMESISEASNVQMERIALLCADDLDAAGILDPDIKPGDPRRVNAGFEHFVHQCYEPLMRQSINEAMQLEEKRRIRALDVLVTLYKHALEDDIWNEHQSTLKDLFTIYCNGMNDKIVVNKLRAALSILGERMPHAIYIHEMTRRFEEEEPLHAETMCMETKGLTITMDMLNALLSGSPPGNVTQSDVEHVIGTLDKPYFWQLLSENEGLIHATAKLLQVMVTRHLSQFPFADTMRVRIVWFATVLRAASRIHHSNNPPTVSVHENATITDLVNQLIGGFAQHVSMVSSVYGHYLSTLLKRICGQSKAYKRPNVWKTSSMELHMLEILVESITGDALENAGVTEQLVELICYAGLRSTKEYQELGDIAVRKRAMQLLSSLFRKDKGEHCLASYEPTFFKHLLTPGLQSAKLIGNNATAYHVELLRAIAAGIEENIISIDAIKTLVIPRINDFCILSNESVLNATMYLQLYASERLQLDNQPDAANELLLSLLDTLRETSDEQALCRQRVLIRISDDQQFVNMVHNMKISHLVKDHTRQLLGIMDESHPSYPSLCRLAKSQDID